MPLTEDYTFQLGDTGVLLNGSSDSLPFVDVHRVTGLDNAPYRTTERDHEGTDGGFMDAEFEKGRAVVVDGIVYTDAAVMEPYLDSLKTNFAPSRTLIPFYFKPPGVSERVLFVKPLGCRYDWDTLRRLGQGPIQFSMFAEDPRIYNAEELSFELDQTSVNSSGRGYNKGYSYGYGSAIVEEQLNLRNNGSRPTPVRFYIPGPITNPTIVNETAGVSLSFVITLVADQTLVVDTQHHTVTINGTVNRRGSLQEPNWFLLETGDNFFRFRADSAGPTTMTAKYRLAWR